MIKEGMIVRFRPEWCEPGEAKHLHIVMENLLNPITGEMTRWLIQTISTDMTIKPEEVVDECMIEPTGFSVTE